MGLDGHQLAIIEQRDAGPILEGSQSLRDVVLAFSAQQATALLAATLSRTPMKFVRSAGAHLPPLDAGPKGKTYFYAPLTWSRRLSPLIVSAPWLLGKTLRGDLEETASF